MVDIKPKPRIAYSAACFRMFSAVHVRQPLALVNAQPPTLPAPDAGAVNQVLPSECPNVG